MNFFLFFLSCQTSIMGKFENPEITITVIQRAGATWHKVVKHLFCFQNEGIMEFIHKRVYEITVKEFKKLAHSWQSICTQFLYDRNCLCVTQVAQVSRKQITPIMCSIKKVLLVNIHKKIIQQWMVLCPLSTCFSVVTSIVSTNC